MIPMFNIKKFIFRTVAVSCFSCCMITASAQVSAADSIPAFNKLLVRGTVTDAITKKPVGGVRVSVTDFSADITDDNGKFSIKVPSYTANLVISAEGYQNREVALKGRNEISVILNDESLSSAFDQVMLPFGSTVKKNVTASIQQYDVNASWAQPFEVPDALLQGRIAGLNAVRRSGSQGSGASLFLRGYNSLFATNKPLVVIDGMLYDANDYGQSIIANNYTNPLALIDAKDIDNISVIRDASSIYGTKGANGAIIITTARAKQQATKIDFGAYTGMNFAPESLPVMDAADYRIYLSEMLQSKGLTSAQIAAQPYMNDNKNNPDYARYHYNTDWQKKVFHNSMNQNYFLKVTGGDNIATYGLSMGLMQSDATVRSTGLTRYNTRFNAEFNLSKKMTSVCNLSFTYNEQDLKDQGISPKTNPIYLALTKAPFLPEHEVNDAGIESPNLADKDTLGISNPAIVIDKVQAFNKYYRFFGSFGFKYDINRYFSASTLLGVVYDKVRENMFIPRKGISNDTLNNAIADSRMGTQVKKLYTIYNDTRVSFNRTFQRKHMLSANVGLRYQHNDSEQDFAYGFNSATDELVSVQTGLNALRQVGGNIGEWNWINGYANADYGFMDKFFVSLNVAMDGSSRFGKAAKDGIKLSGNKFAVMPSLGVAWLLSSEKFMNSSVIDLLKLRATVSRSGNDDIGNYSWRQTYTSQNLLGMQGLVRSGVANPALQWETSTRINGGIDIGLLNERISASVDVYNNKTTNMLVYEMLASNTGFNSILTNNGSMTTNGIDASVSVRVINKKDLKYDASINIGTYKNKIGQVPNGSFTTQFAGATLLTANGKAGSVFYGHTTNGVFSTDAEAAASGLRKKNADGSFSNFKAGDMHFIDLNGDQLIDDNDRSVIGDPNPALTGGFSNHVSWKRFGFDALFTFSSGNDVFNYLRYKLESGATTENQLISMNNRWRTNGQVTSIPKITYGDPMGNSRFSDRWIEDGSYFRLRSLSVSYNIPFKKQKMIKNTTIYAAANNLFTLTKYMGYDPEFSVSPSVFAQGIDTGFEPQFRSVMLGLRIGL